MALTGQLRAQTVQPVQNLRLDLILDQRAADFGRAAFLVNVGFVFIAEEAQRADDRVGRALAQAAQGRAQ